MTEKTPGQQRWLLLALAVLSVGLTCSLGMWQLGRAAEKTALHEARTQQAEKPLLLGQSLTVDADPSDVHNNWMHRRMVLVGHWQHQHTVYLENRQMNAKPGFFVLTPFKLEGSEISLVVQRGWVQRSFTDRTALPSVEQSNERTEVLGNLAPWPSRLYDFGGEEKGPIRQNLDWQGFKQETGLDLPKFTLLQTGAASEGLLREWPVVASGVEKHHGYAFQWFGLSALIALLYVWFQIVQPRRSSKIR